MLSALDKLILEEALKCVAGECWGAYGVRYLSSVTLEGHRQPQQGEGLASPEEVRETTVGSRDWEVV